RHREKYGLAKAQCAQKSRGLGMARPDHCTSVERRKYLHVEAVGLLADYALTAAARLRCANQRPTSTISKAPTISAASFKVPEGSPNRSTITISVTSIPPAIQPSSAAPKVTTLGKRSISFSTRVLPQTMMG